MVTTKQKVSIGSLLLILLVTGIVYVSMGDDVRIRVDNDKTTFYVKNDNNRWIVSGREYLSIFDGTSKMNRRVSSIKIDTIIDNVTDTVTITKTTPYIRGPIIKETYFFDGKLTDIELFPVNHKIEVINGSGYFFRYEARDLVYDGDTYKLIDETELSFGLNMKLTFEPNYRWGWVYKTGIVKLQYDISTDYEVYNVRLFDPVVQTVYTSSGTFTVPAGVTSVEVLVVAGGAGGGAGKRYGYTAGGGGAGGLIYNSSYSVTPEAELTVTVGAGGGGTTNDLYPGGAGGNSVFGTITTTGGGGGISNRASAGNGGSGGGGKHYGIAGGTGIPGQGYDGGDGGASYSVTAGGGGGASEEGHIGGNGGAGSYGDGGDGLNYSTEFGTSVGVSGWFAGGGGGGSNTNGAAGAGGAGGGAEGGDSQYGYGDDATDGTGGGGGGGANGGGDGGKGIVIVRYVTVPTVNIIYPIAATYSENVSTLNYNTSEEDASSCWYSTDNGTTNSSFVSSGTNFTNITSVAGSNTWTVYCNDTSNNIGSNSVTFNLSEIWFNTDYPFANKSFRITEFIGVDGTDFTLAGEIYKFLGTDSYYLSDYATNHTYDDDGNEINNSQEYVLELLNEAQYLNFNVIRTWASMQGGGDSHWNISETGGHYNLFERVEPGNYSEEMFVALDWVVYQASLRDVRLQLVLINNWNDYGGMRWYVQQSPTTDKTYENVSSNSEDDWWTFHDQFYTDENCREYYRNYISYLLNRTNTYSGLKYKNDPAIFAWMLANEPRAKTDGIGRSIIKNWTINMTDYVKNIDTNHLVGLGIEGWGYVETWGEGTDMIADHNETGVDFATFALHPDQWQYFAERSEHSIADGGGWVTDDMTTNAYVDWWTNDTDISWNNRYSGSNIPAYIPALARYGYKDWIRQNVEWANDLNMPILHQEAGYFTNHTKAIKDRFYSQMIHNFYSTGGDGLMVWTFNHDNYYYNTDINGTMDDGYGFYVSNDEFLHNKSESVLDAISFTLTDNDGGSWVKYLNSYKYDFVFSVETASDKTVANATLYLNISNSTDWRLINQINTSGIIENDDYIFTVQFNDSDTEIYWYIEVCSRPSICINSTVKHIQIKTGTPDIELSFPDDNGNYSTTTLNFNYTVGESDGLDMSNCELYINDTLNKTDNTIIKGIIQTFTVDSFADGAYDWYIKCTDIDDNTNNSFTRSFTINTVLPNYSDNSTNSTLAGTSIEHRLKWTDDKGLSGYIFSFDNGIGTFTNDSWVAFPNGGTEDWSNVTKTVTSTLGATIKWCVYANDTFNNWNNSCDSPFIYTTTMCDTNFSIWTGSEWADAYDDYLEFRCTPTQTDCEPTNQDAGNLQAIYRICNNGTVTGSGVYIMMNQTITGINLKCDDDYTTEEAITISTSNQTIHGELTVDSCTDICCWADYNYPPSGGFFDTYAFVII